MARAMGGLAIGDDAANADPKIASSNRVGPPDLPHGGSAPPVLEEATIRRQRSTEQVGAKRRILETRKHESAESGDDEDDELGHAPIRRSPKTRPKSTSKLGIEMMRTNSRGSVISVEDPSQPDSMLPSSPPPMITEDRAAEEYEGSLPTSGSAPPSLTPPVIFPEQPGDDVEEFVMETPKAQKETTSPDPDPTPKAKNATTPKASSAGDA